MAKSNVINVLSLISNIDKFLDCNVTNQGANNVLKVHSARKN